MKRDMQVIRKLILYLEEAEPGCDSDDIDLELDTDVLEYHMRLMDEAGLICITPMRGGVIFNRMTWQGHDFADAARDDVVWKKTLRKVAETTKSVTFELLTHLLKGTLAKEFVD